MEVKAGLPGSRRREADPIFPCDIRAPAPCRTCTSALMLADI